MRNRLVPLLSLTLLATGCGTEAGPTRGGEPTDAQRAARIELIRSNSEMNDLELAHLCPALYPADVLKDPKKYGFDKQKAKLEPSAADLSLAAKADCGAPVPIATPASSGNRPGGSSGKPPAKTTSKP